ncbi:thiolase C-terminal domain-containing protein [Nocardioides sp. Bht2]|uniref:thiolase C-terminal domain-containing protein n=1 Tax=Nocardioides sp. Bht2 TaxID=3392297 RepID=UPI0039B53F0D
MTIHPFRDRAAIVGVGTTPYFKNSGATTLALALRSITAALADAGLTPGDVDGLATHRINDSASVAVVGQTLGIKDLAYFNDQFGGGSTSHSVIGQAAMAVATGQAEVVVCWRSLNSRSGRRMGGTGQAPPGGEEFQYLTPHGYAVPPQMFAMAARAYMNAVDVSSEDLAEVAIAQRWYAARNPNAMQRRALTLDDYMAAPMIADPLRLYDCCLETDTGVALVVTSAERARDLRQVPVLIAAAAWGGGQNTFSNGSTDPSRTAAAQIGARLWRQSGLSIGDVDVAEIYDAFTPLVLMQLEGYGFCRPGEAAQFIREGHTRPKGRLPVNTHGGHLSGGYAHGLNHVQEAVMQLRGLSGERQVPNAQVALSTGQPGLTSGASSALLLRCAS